MAKTEKVFYILEQVRLCLDRKDFIRCALPARQNAGFAIIPSFWHARRCRPSFFCAYLVSRQAWRDRRRASLHQNILNAVLACKAHNLAEGGVCLPSRAGSWDLGKERYGLHRAHILAKKVSPRAFVEQPGKKGQAAGEVGIEGTTIEAPDAVRCGHLCRRDARLSGYCLASGLWHARAFGSRLYVTALLCLKDMPSLESYGWPPTLVPGMGRCTWSVHRGVCGHLAGSCGTALQVCKATPSQGWFRDSSALMMSSCMIIRPHRACVIG